MKKFLLTLLIVGALGGGAYYYMLNSGKIELPEPEVIIRTPESYHMLEAMGGVPMNEAVQAGLVTPEYAYLRAMQPIQMADGIELPERLRLGGKSYELGYKINTIPTRDQVLEFNLLGTWDELHFGFGFEDAEASDPSEEWSIKLIVQVDGETKAEVESISPVDKPYFAKVDVSGANRVTFISRRVGFQNPFAPILVDPFVLKLNQ